MFTTLVFVVIKKLIIMTDSVNWITSFFLLVSFIFYLLCVLLIDLEVIGPILQKELYKKVLYCFTRPGFFPYLLTVSLIILLPDISFKFYKRILATTPLDYIILKSSIKSSNSTVITEMLNKQSFNI